ncbi:hypothetical protein KKA14_15955, partial [bacterium]|nr:hypothetical protein [bacterium]
CLVLIALLSLVLTTSLSAQDKIYSLSLKQHEIEQDIRKSLASYLSEKDYVVKVMLTGIQRTEVPRSDSSEYRQEEGDALPGFEQESKTAMTRITDMIGSSFWQIKSMKIDLIMHKQISPSVDTYIREMVPVVSEMVPSRGDLFNFIPILPKTIEEAKDQVKEEAQFVADGKGTKEYYGLALQEWIYFGIAILFLLTVLILVWRLVKMRGNLLALEDAIEEGQIFERDGDTESIVDIARKEKEERLQKQEQIIRNSILEDKNEKTLQEIITQLLGRRDWAEQLVDDFGKDKQGVANLSVFFSILGPVTARKLFADIMGDDEYLEMERMSDEVNSTPEQERNILQEIQKILFAKKLTSPERIISDPFNFLRELTTGQVGFLVKDEPVKIKAIVLSQLSSPAAAEILSKIDKDERGKVIQQLGNMSNLPLELAEKVAYNLADKAKDIPDDNTVGLDGVDMVVEVISESDSRIRKDMINSLRVTDRKLSDKVESRFFLFDSIPVVPREALTEVVRKLPPEDVITAIVGSSKNLQEKVIMCFPEKNRRTLVSSLKSQKPTPELIKSKRKLIIQSMQIMAANKKVDLRKIQAAWEKATGKKPSIKSA